MKEKNLYEPPEVKILYFGDEHTDLIHTSNPDEDGAPNAGDMDGSWIPF